jgi:N6-L-threonylcarbamoyladenine synthase
MSTVILAIESSCDDTSASICKDGKILANVIAGQAVHEAWGGVVPELASRAHQQNIVPVVEAAMKKAGIAMGEISAVAFTKGPGLLGSLLVGVSFAKGFALANNLPLIEVHHMQAHVLAHFIESAPRFPFLCLTVSGGHTQLVFVKDFLETKILGETIDDAAGEAFDKSAKMMGLPYPGGPLIDKYAQTGNPTRFKFNQPKVGEFDFSFSGLKTSILYFLQAERKKNPAFVEENLHDLCASIQYTIIDMLMKKLTHTAKAYHVKDIAIAGGVAANSGLRTAVKQLAELNGWNYFIPEFEYCTDNAAMIAITAYYKYLKGDFTTLDAEPMARWEMNTLATD